MSTSNKYLRERVAQLEAVSRNALEYEQRIKACRAYLQRVIDPNAPGDVVDADIFTRLLRILDGQNEWVDENIYTPVIFGSKNK